MKLKLSISLSNNTVKYKNSNTWVGLNNVLDGVKELPSVTTADNGKVLQVVAGKWELGNVSASGNYLPLSGGTLSGNLSVTGTITESGVALSSKYAALSHTHSYAGSSSNGGAANSANILNSNTKMDYGWNGINYFNISGTAGKAAKVNDTPTTAWWHIMRFNHANSSGYYTDLAIPFNDTSLYYKRITSGAVQNGGWVKVLDSLNYTSYCAASSHTHSYLPLSGGSISGNLSVNGVIQAYHIYDTTLAYGIGTGTAQKYPYVHFRGSGNVGSNRELSLVYYDSSGAAHFNKLMDSSGNLCLQSASKSIKIHATNHVILSADGYALYFGVGITSGTKSLTPRTTSGGAADNKIVLGSSSSRWTTCFAKNGVSTSSDERDKDIFELDGRYKNLFMNTKPIIYRWNDDDSNIFHVGVGAQSYEASAHECGLTTEEVGAIRHDYWDKPNENGRTDRYSINYDEVVMLAVPFVQEHEKKIQALEEENSTLKIELAELKELVQQLIA